MFPFSIFNWHYPFLTNLVQKIKIENLSWNLVFQLIRICRIQWWHSFYWTPCDSWKGPSILSSVLLSKRFLAIVLVFSEYWHSARNPYEVVCDWAEFSQKKFFCPKIWENGPKMGQKQGFLNLSKDLVFNFLLNLFYNENLYYLLCSSTNPIFLFLGKFLFLRYGPKCSQLNRL